MKTKATWQEELEKIIQRGCGHGEDCDPEWLIENILDWHTKKQDEALKKTKNLEKEMVEGAGWSRIQELVLDLKSSLERIK